MSSLPLNPEAQFLAALGSSAMVAPGLISKPLFPPEQYDMRLSGEVAINNGAPDSFDARFLKVVIILGVAYGRNNPYMGDEQVLDCRYSLPIRVFGRTGADLQDTLQRLRYARNKNQAAFSSFGIYDIAGDDHARMLPYDSVKAIAALTWTINFRYEET